MGATKHYALIAFMAAMNSNYLIFDLLLGWQSISNSISSTYVV